MVNPGESVDAAERAFSKAHREAILRRAWARARHAPSSVTLASFEEAKISLGSKAQRIEKISLGVREVALQSIVGSVARSRDFDDKFLPLNKDLAVRWKKVYRTFQLKEALGTEVPPLNLYRIGNVHFVNDGNHRVSVARFRGWNTIKSEVTVLRARPNDPCSKI